MQQTQQLQTLDYSTAFQFGNDRAFEAAHRLAQLAPGDLNKVFFCTSGSEAADTALKIALAYHRARGQGQRTVFIGRERGYHGVGFGGMSVGGIPANRKVFGTQVASFQNTRFRLAELQTEVQIGRTFVDRCLEALLEDKLVGESARKLYADARKMLDRIVREKWLTAKGVVSFWPCRRDGDDVVLFEDETFAREVSRLHFLRQQVEKRSPRANMCLADFISPRADWIGGFAVTAGHGIEQHLARFKAEHDDYSDILLKALADRLAEAFAERLHERVRKTIWGYAPDEALSNDDLVREKYRGIRPAPGYPACPDHSQKPELFRLLNAGQNAGLTLTESFAMIPISSVSGYYFAHPEAQYFGVARIGRDQVEDYARRRGIPVEQAERYLRPNIGY